MTGSSSFGIIASEFPNRTRGGPAPAPPLPVGAAKPSATAAKQPIPRSTLVAWNASLFFFHATLATITLVFGKTDLLVPTYKTVLTFVLRSGDAASGDAASGDVASGDATTSGEVIGGWDLIPLYEQAGELAFTLLVAAFFVLSAGFHLLNATLLRDYYLRELAECRTPTRWIEYFFSASIMQLLIAYTLGIRDRSLLLTITVLVGITMPFGYWTETIARPASADEWTEPLSYRLLPWFLGNVPQCAAWFIVVAQFYDANSGSMDMIPWFVHLILWGELLLFFSFGFVQLAVQCLPPKMFYRGELVFQILSLVSKGLLGMILLANVLMLSRFDDLYD